MALLKYETLSEWLKYIANIPEIYTDEDDEILIGYALRTFNAPYISITSGEVHFKTGQRKKLKDVAIQILASLEQVNNLTTEKLER